MRSLGKWGVDLVRLEDFNERGELGAVGRTDIIVGEDLRNRLDSALIAGKIQEKTAERKN